MSAGVRGQFVDYGSEPARIRWKTARTSHYQLIYPASNDSLARCYAQYLEQIYPYMGKTIGRSAVRAFPVVLHSGNMLSNGLVAWAPRRMELLTTPSSEASYSQSWAKHLTLHESRHVLQMYKLSQGLFRPLYVLLGEQTAGIASAFIPEWFFEGDAVATETAMSNSGRGRTPEFSMAYRSQMLSDRRFYSYDKWASGSYRDYTGDYYALGYHLTAFARYRYGADTWERVTSRYTRRFFHLPPFSKALKYVTGVRPPELFEETFRFLHREWTAQDSVYHRSGFGATLRYVTPPPRRYTSYTDLQVLEDSSILAIKTSLDEIASLVMIKGGNEKRLCFPGRINSRILAVRDRVYWTEYVPGLRWTHENYSVLKYYDLLSRQIVTVTPGARFLAPALSKTGRIAVLSQPSVAGVNRVVALLLPEAEASRHNRAFRDGRLWSENDAPGDRKVRDENLRSADGLGGENLRSVDDAPDDRKVRDGNLRSAGGLGGENLRSENDAPDDRKVRDDNLRSADGLGGGVFRDRETVRSYDTPFNGFVKEMTFMDERRIAAVVVHDKGLSLFQLDLPTGQWEEWRRFASAHIASLTACEGRLYFTSGADGTNNICVFDPSTSEITRLTTSRFGASAPAFSGDGRTLFFSDYSANGYRIASVPVDRLQKLPADFDRAYPSVLADALAQQEQFNLDTALSTPIEFDPAPYRKASHLFQVHSWTPFYYDASGARSALSDDLRNLVKPGCMILSQNRLSTMVTQAGWYYDNRAHHVKGAVTYRGWFPVVDVSVDYGGRAFDYEWRKNDQNDYVSAYRVDARKLLEAKAQLSVPFNLTRHHEVSGFQPSLACYYTNNRYQQLESRKFRPYYYLLAELRYYRYRRQAHRDLLPRLGYQIHLQYLGLPSGADNFGSLYAARLITYFPGLVRGHGLMLRVMYQYQNLEGKAFYTPQQLISQPRGYPYDYQTRQRVEWKADYVFSLFHPDWNAWGLAYVKRIRSNVFYDLSKNQVRTRGLWTTRSSCGADLIVDCHLLRLSYPMSLGVRIVQPLTYGVLQAEGLFSVSF
jgi:hypothetical protein